MSQMVLNFNVEIPKKVYDKWDEFIELVKEIDRNLKATPGLRRKLEDLFRGNRITLKSDDCGGQQPEPYTKEYIVEPILKFLGYEPRKKEYVMKSATKKETCQIIG